MPRNGRRDAVRNPPHPHLASSFLSSLFAGSSSKHNKQSLERIRNRSAHLDLVPLPSCPLAIDPPRGRAGSLSPGSPEDGEVLRRIGIQPEGKPRSVVKMPWNAHPPRPAPPRHALRALHRSKPSLRLDLAVHPTSPPDPATTDPEYEDVVSPKASAKAYLHNHPPSSLDFHQSFPRFRTRRSPQP